MTTAQIIELQKRVGAEPDGHWGPKSIASCQTHLRRLMPAQNPWPRTEEFALRSFYGDAGDESNLVYIDLPEGTLYEGNPIKRTRCHKLVAASLSRVLAEIALVFPRALKEFDGCFNNRAMRGGTKPSLHARGAAIDFMASTNGNHDHWPTVANMPLEVMEAFAREGWTSAGAWWNRDAMHAQATRL